MGDIEPGSHAKVDRAEAATPRSDRSEHDAGRRGPHLPSLNFRVVALAPVVLFIPSLVSFAIAEPGTVWPEYPGIFFHLAFLKRPRFDAAPV